MLSGSFAGLVLAACGAFDQEAWMDPVRTEPFSIAAGPVEVSADIGHDRATDTWNVTVVLTRAAGHLPVDAGDVSIQMLDAEGRPFEVTRRPTGPLPEAGGSLGVSANARFGLRGPGRLPDRLVVTYRGSTPHFRILHGDRPKSS
jgi:hypothetical protein